MDHEEGIKSKSSLEMTQSNGKVFLTPQHFVRVKLRKQISGGLAFGSAKQSIRGNLGGRFVLHSAGGKTVLMYKCASWFPIVVLTQQ